jgi:hypothetical protein
MMETEAAPGPFPDVDWTDGHGVLGRACHVKDRKR